MNADGTFNMIDEPFLFDNYPICPKNTNDMSHTLVVCLLLGVLAGLLISRQTLEKHLLGSPQELEEDGESLLNHQVLRQQTLGFQGY